MLLSAQCGPSGVTAIADDGRRFRVSYVNHDRGIVTDDGCPVSVDAENAGFGATVRSRPSDRFERLPDNRYDPARMTDEERAAMLASDLWNDCQPVTITIRLFHRIGWSIRDLLDDESNPVPKVPEYVAYSRLPVSGESEGYKMPAPIVTPSRMGREPNYGVQGLAELSAFLKMLAKRFDPVPHDETKEDRLREYAKRHPELCGS